MKLSKRFELLLLSLMLLLCAGLLVACDKDGAAEDRAYVVIDGDIEGGSAEVTLSDIETTTFTYSDDGEDISAEGWNLEDVLKNVKPSYGGNMLMITASDGVSALIDLPLTGSIYLYLGDGGKVCCKGVDYPRSTGIKNISELTVVTTEAARDGYKVLTPQSEEFVSRGNAKLRLFTLSAENSIEGNTTRKYLPAADRSVSSFTGETQNIVYTADYDIIKDASAKPLGWERGLTLSPAGEARKPVYGFVTGVDRALTDSYDDMKSALDEDGRVMFVLVDGFSWQQAEFFADALTTLAPGPTVEKAASTHLAISPVALAAIVTGQSPYANGVHFDEGESRAVLRPKVGDIFGYATAEGKSTAYFEGNGNLILTGVEPEYSTSDAVIYSKALDAARRGTEFIFVHFHEVDDVNHSDGPLSEAAKARLLTTEERVRGLINAFGGRVIVASDHGHNTLFDDEGRPYGKHGTFTNRDMYVPYFTFEA